MQRWLRAAAFQYVLNSEDIAVGEDPMVLRWILGIVGIAVGVPAHAQLNGPVKNGEMTIIVTGVRPNEKKVEMSRWRVAETPHVMVFSQGNEKALRQTAHNLEKLHFLLSTLHGRVDTADETIKIAVTMIGDAGSFEQLRLTDLRWQYGPFPPAFSKTIYYDPREEGSVLATTEDGVNVIMQPSDGGPTPRNCEGDGNSPLNSFVGNFTQVSSVGAVPEPDLSDFLSKVRKNEISFCQSAESRLYAGFAQNYLMTYFPAAYPRWFMQGFGEMFATLIAKEGEVEYGHLPTGYFKVQDYYFKYPITHVLDGRYLTGKGRTWTPYHAWRLVHLLYFSDEWKPRLQAYLEALGRGDDLKSAATALGEPAALQRAVINYRGRKLEAERITFPAERAPEPVIYRLTRAEAGLIQGRLELGARIDLPVKESRDHKKALARRAAWLERLRANATRFPNLIEHQLLLAEGECRAGNSEPCLAAAERVIAQSPKATRALVWKGTALTQLAARAPTGERPQRLAEARKSIVRANRLDPESSLALLAYHGSFAGDKGQAPDIAVDGLFKVVRSAPAAPGPRVKLGKELIKRDLKVEAQKTLLPVAKGPFETPEQPVATKLLTVGNAMEPES
ncbi:tetratricopeptide repeat protein [Sphingomonas qomolangmaensis]|uniref:Tetratricopeptide repeat protein n=1 Tax=Sphingomonas qomolangmaensis TaxID=2918765 RepID=A0ABY5LD84_9SPHN|nr:hypothetical protein [Sphingomonas qomolangmaensis]UUL83790.1 hypothetical protein NMP03_06235 [Sphingomonas qomolangmaensis]